MIGLSRSSTGQKNFRFFDGDGGGKIAGGEIVGRMEGIRRWVGCAGSRRRPEFDGRLGVQRSRKGGDGDVGMIRGRGGRLQDDGKTR